MQRTKGYPMKSNLLCALPVFFFFGNQISGTFGYPSVPLYGEDDNPDPYFRTSLGSPTPALLNQLKTNLDEIAGMKILLNELICWCRGFR